MKISEQISLLSGVIARLRESDIDDSSLMTFRNNCLARQREGEEDAISMPDEIRDHLVREHRRRAEHDYQKKRDSGEIDRRQEELDDLREDCDRLRAEIAKIDRDHKGDRSYLLKRRQLKKQLDELESQRSALKAERRDEREAFNEPEPPTRMPTEEETVQLEQMKAEVTELASYSRRYPADRNAKTRWSIANRELRTFAKEVGADVE